MLQLGLQFEMPESQHQFFGERTWPTRDQNNTAIKWLNKLAQADPPVAESNIVL